MNVDFCGDSQMGRVRLWCESLDSTCPLSTVQAGGGGVMVWGMSSSHTLGPLIAANHCLNVTAYQSIVVNHAHWPRFTPII